MSLSEMESDEMYKDLYEEMKDLKPKVDRDFTAWIKLIKVAELKFLNSNDEWADDDTLIQIKQLSQTDITASENADENEDENTDEHYNTKWLDVIKLPMAVPTGDRFKTDQILFVRPDEYEIFLSLGNVRKSILTGNPGISKSWFQFKYILFCYRKDLYKELHNKHLERKNINNEIVESMDRDLFFPDLIVRTVPTGSNHVSHFFFFMVLTMCLKLFMIQLTYKILPMTVQPSYGNHPNQ
jgi:hypothetical protein